MQPNEIGLLILIALGGVTIFWVFYGDHSSYDDRRIKIKKLQEEIREDIENLK